MTRLDPEELEIPERMQRALGFAPLGPADGPVKAAILGENNARLYEYTGRAALGADRVAAARAAYEAAGPSRRNVRYGYVRARTPGPDRS